MSAARPAPARRQTDTGLVRPYRTCPADFVDVYLTLGQDKAIEEHYRTNWRCIRRWIEESGGDELRRRRYQRSGGFARPNKRSDLEALQG